MEQPSRIELYGTEYCGYCTAARLLLKKKGLNFKDIPISADESARQEMLRRAGATSVPQIFINDQLIGGFDKLHALDQSGELDRLLLAGDADKQK